MLILCHDHICTTYRFWNKLPTSCVALDQQFRWLKVQLGLGFQLSELTQIDAASARAVLGYACRILAAETCISTQAILHFNIDKVYV